MSEQKFFRCEICGNLVNLLHDGNAPMTCCGQEMKQIVANTAEAALEKHVPKVEKRERLVSVQVGSTMHPSTTEHHIEFICLLTDNGTECKRIEVGSEPKAMFMTLDGRPLEVYAYCNMHGLWKTDVLCDCGCGKTVKECTCKPECHHGEDAHKSGCGCKTKA